MGLKTQSIDSSGITEVVIPAQGYEGESAAVIEHEHFKVEEGEMFGASSGPIQGAAAGSVFDCIVVPVDNNIDLTFQASSNAGFEVLIFEAPTITGSGSEVSLINFNRSIGGVGAVTYYCGAALATTGLTLWREDIPAASGPFGGGSSFVAAHEWILVAGTVYGFRITPKAVGTLNTVVTIY